MAPELSDLLARGSALSRSGEQDSAVAVYRRALARWPNEYRVRAGLGAILDLVGRFDEAREHWTRAIAIASPDQVPATRQHLAVSFAFECRADDAASIERATIDTHLSRQDFAAAAAVYNEQARIYLECGNPDNALRWYRDGYDTALRTVDLSESAKSLWAFRWEHAQARVAARRGQVAEAQRHVGEAKAVLDRGLNPGEAPSLPYLIGYVAFHAGDYRTAISELRRANSTDPFVLALLAQAYEHVGDDSEAESYRQRARAINGHGLTVALAHRMTARP